MMVGIRPKRTFDGLRNGRLTKKLDFVRPSLTDWPRVPHRTPGRKSSEPGWPKPLSDAALYGLAGDFVERIAPHTEADPALLLFDFLTVFGNLVGRGPHYLVEADEHPAELNVLMVGETAKARKGTGTGRVVKFYAAAVPGGIDGRTMHGFSSGEGLIERVRDARIEPDPKTGEPKTVDAGVDDKRLLVIQDEFASTLAVMTRQGNTLAGIFAKRLRR